jgi:hypothetical protein
MPYWPRIALACSLLAAAPIGSGAAGHYKTLKMHLIAETS